MAFGNHQTQPASESIQTMSRLTDYSRFDHLTEDDDDDDDSAAEKEETTTTTAAAARAAPKATAAAPGTLGNHRAATKPAGVIRRDESSGRYRFEYNGRTVYEFEQSLDDVTIYVLPPPYVTKGHQINCVIAAKHFKLGLVGHGEGGQPQWFLNEATYGTVDTDESTWTLEDYDGDDGDNGGANRNNNNGNRRKIIVVTLIKANRGAVWEAAFRGNPDAAGPTNNTKTNGTPAPSTTMDALSKEQVKKDLMLQRFQEENPGFDFTGADFNGSVPDAREFMGGVKYR